MATRRTVLTVCGLLMLGVAAWSVSVTAQKKDTSAAPARVAAEPGRIWQDPGDMASLDLLYGSGGKAHAPDLAGTFTFVSEDAAATNPKFDVTDGQGAEWKVKLGPEARPETAATRFLWAAGYFSDEDYYVAEVAVKGLPELRRGRGFVSAGGVIHGARFERTSAAVEKLGDWDWFDNPFVGQRELNGLRVMMSLVNNWDLKQVNNSIYTVNGERRYTVSDAGSSFGKTGTGGAESKGVPKDFEDSKFVAKVTPDSVNLTFNSRPLFLLWAFSPSYYDERTRMEKIAKDIPRADARWLGKRLSMLSDGQIGDAFRAAGYGARDVETLTRTIRRRIAALEAL